MTDTFRALCAELLEAVQLYAGLDPAAADTPTSQRVAWLIDAMANTTAALAQPEPQGPTDEELWDLYQHLGSYFSPTEFARTVLARWGRPAIEPVPVSERLPGPEDCDAEGRCWVFDDMLGLPSWTLVKVLGKNLEPDMTWLPHWALPVPKQEGEQ